MALRFSWVAVSELALLGLESALTKTRRTREFFIQIIHTDVAQATAPNGQPLLRVIFCGEGGECVTVDMANVEAGNDGAAIDRARAILVQTATFDLAVNDYDAQSNGNFDRVGVTAAHDENGHVYIFEYCDGNKGRCVPPAMMPSLEAAREEGVRRAVDLLGELQPGSDDLTGSLVRIREGGNGVKSRSSQMTALRPHFGRCGKGCQDLRSR